MSDSEYVEPTNEQLAKFLVIYAKQIPGMSNLQLNAPHLELLMTNNPSFREAGLKHHKAFVADLAEYSRKLHAGELQCEYIRPNKKKCPNHNQPGSEFCGLHQEIEK